MLLTCYCSAAAAACSSNHQAFCQLGWTGCSVVWGPACAVAIPEWQVTYVMLSAALTFFTTSVLLAVGVSCLLQLVDERDVFVFVLTSPRLFILPVPLLILGEWEGTPPFDHCVRRTGPCKVACLWMNSCSFWFRKYQ